MQIVLDRAAPSSELHCGLTGQHLGVVWLVYDMAVVDIPAHTCGEPVCMISVGDNHPLYGVVENAALRRLFDYYSRILVFNMRGLYSDAGWDMYADMQQFCFIHTPIEYQGSAEKLTEFCHKLCAIAAGVTV